MNGPPDDEPFIPAGLILEQWLHAAFFGRSERPLDLADVKRVMVVYEGGVAGGRGRGETQISDEEAQDFRESPSACMSEATARRRLRELEHAQTLRELQDALRNEYEKFLDQYNPISKELFGDFLDGRAVFEEFLDWLGGRSSDDSPLVRLPKDDESEHSDADVAMLITEEGGDVPTICRLLSRSLFRQEQVDKHEERAGAVSPTGSTPPCSKRLLRSPLTARIEKLATSYQQEGLISSSPSVLQLNPNQHGLQLGCRLLGDFDDEEEVEGADVYAGSAIYVFNPTLKSVAFDNSLPTAHCSTKSSTYINSAFTKTTTLARVVGGWGRVDLITHEHWFKVVLI